MAPADPAAPPQASKALYRIAGFTLDLSRGRLSDRAGQHTTLRPKTAEVLRCLIEHAGQVISRELLLSRVWPDVVVTDDSITQCITEIRRALGAEGARLLRTLPRRGYLLDAEVERRDGSMAGPVPEPAPLPPPELPDRPSVAVLPFRQLVLDPAETYFADGIVDEVIHALAGVRELFVIARTSTLGYSGATPDTRAIGRELGVRYVLYGSVRRDHERLRITTELSDALSGQVIHSDRYDGELHDIFEVQGRIALKALRVIAPHVRERELQRAMRKPPESLTAYDCVLRAQALLDRMDFAAHTQAEGLLRDAIRHDPSYAAAYTALAFWHIFRVGEGWSNDTEAESAAAAEAARTAMQLDGNDAMAAAIYGYVLSYMYREHEQAMALHEQAIDICPNSAGAWTLGSAIAGFIGNGPLAVDRAQLGLRLSPLDTHIFWHEAILAQAHYINDAYEEAVVWATRSSRRTNSAIFILRTLAASLVALGRREEAAEVARRLMRVQPNFTLTTYRRRCPFVPTVLEPWIERLREAGLPP